MTMCPLSLLILLLLSFNLQPKIIVALANPSDHDFSYMKSVKEAIDFPEAEEYDYIVVGGGTAGCPLAATLSEKYSVLVLERGNVPQKHPNVLRAEGFIANVIEEENESHDTPAERFTSEEGVGILRGRVLGGTSMINAGFFSRASEDYFGSNEGVEWDMGLVDEAYRWVEDTIVTQPERVADWQLAVKDSLLEAGVGPDNGFNLDHKIGTKFSGSTFDDSGRRHGAVELLNRGNLENLRVAIHASVERIMFYNDHAHSRPSAIGVAYTDKKNKSHVAFVRNKGEVILSAGALGSPQLLLLSGIGPDSELSQLGIPSVKSNSGVGKFMADNPRSNINLVIPFPLQSSVIQVAGITKDYVIETISYSLSLSPAPMPFGLFGSPSSTDSSLATFIVKPPGPLSHGSLRLASPRSVKTAPLVRFNYFSHPKDLERCVVSMRKVGEILESASLERFKYLDLAGEKGFMFLGPVLPGNRSDDELMREYCRSSVTSFWHYHGGCLVGKAIDGYFRVFGVGALRVVDGSTFTTSPGTNPQATLMMLGRYMGVKMLRERSGSNYSSFE